MHEAYIISGKRSSFDSPLDVPKKNVKTQIAY